MKKICLETTDLCKTYIVDGYSNNVLQNINLKVEEGEFVSIMGPSGSGRSTLLYTISGMDDMTAGSVIFDGEDLSKMNEKQLTKLRLSGAVPMRPVSPGAGSVSLKRERSPESFTGTSM